MAKKSFLFLVMCCGLVAHSQDHRIVLMKKNKVKQQFWLNGPITFQTRDGQWQYGIIKKIRLDSFDLTKEYIYRNFGRTDTMHVSGYVFSLKDIRGLPSKNQITVVNGNQVKLILGHEKFVWIRNGFLFQAAGGAYAVVSVTNYLIDKDHTGGQEQLNKLAIAAGLFLFGQILHWTFDPTVKIKKNVRLEVREY
ncbi:MAG: hypothetical protein ACJ75B_21175 [Flavisolibacter sp.]